MSQSARETFTAKNIIIRSKDNKFTPDSNRMCLNESKHTPSRETFTIAFSPEIRDATAVLIRFTLNLKNLLHWISRKGEMRVTWDSDGTGSRGRQVQGAGLVFRSWNPCVVSHWPRTQCVRRFLQVKRKFSIVRFSNLRIVNKYRIIAAVIKRFSFTF